ncbi:hypothetical protein PCANC_08595 [Puccinia coronata f. sp. avenae]|uniref:Uncharacterized protein n=1 Tax=Puccinia coronata f. sp. avenae TaxID=200324 RepID=A0A2N5S9X0_9BASI|nr:hypothetical protein PCANC_22763 [Puccinia coronata f. sp. avenae]PLW42520.1 hypothetical protein PCANC_08595 [Puccinia coronata f. sp. avenae]
MKTAHRQEQTEKHSPITPSYTRAALSPFLSLPSKIDCEMSTSNPGDCEKLLQKLSRPVAIKNHWQINDETYKHKLRKSNNQRANINILSVFLKINGGYLDDSDKEDDDDEEEDDDEIFYRPQNNPNLPP